MALYKVTKAEDAFQYFPAGHYDVRCTRLHTADDLEGGKLTLGLSHFLPQGGVEDFVSAQDHFGHLIGKIGQAMLARNHLPLGKEGQTDEKGQKNNRYLFHWAMNA